MQTDLFDPYNVRNTFFSWNNKIKRNLTLSDTPLTKHKEWLKKIAYKPGVYSYAAMCAAGFEYTGDRDMARCKDCGLEVADWTADMNPFDIHLKRNPDCPFLCSIKTRLTKQLPPITHRLSKDLSRLFLEYNTIQEVRERTFSHWPRTIPTSRQMIEAGFFYCNVGDRVICLYCNIICQGWSKKTDDPCDVHKTLSPKCIYVQGKLILSSNAPVMILNENLTNYLSIKNSLDPLQSNDIVFTTARYPDYAQLPKRRESFVECPIENLPPVNDLVRAGFFYAARGNFVTCFYCGGSLQNLDPNINPMIPHAIWLPNCAYIKQLCGVKNYRQIQETNRAHQQRAKGNELNQQIITDVITNSNPIPNDQPSLVLAPSYLDQLVADRLDLQISQDLRKRGFKRSIIKRCWENQLRLKEDDFATTTDLYIACLILQKQIKYIHGDTKNIIIPRQRIQKNDKKELSLMPSNLCVVCLEEKNCLALLPCGHLAACVPCGHSLTSCPICRKQIRAYIRIYN